MILVKRVGELETENYLGTWKEKMVRIDAASSSQEGGVSNGSMAACLDGEGDCMNMEEEVDNYHVE